MGLLERIAPEARLLDLGCGNGEFYRALAQRGFTGCYLGLDFSPGLLADASPGTGGAFQVFDLTQTDWSPVLAHAPFDHAAAFAVLHHLPGRVLRLQILRRLRSLLAPGDLFFHSEWQFLNSARLRARIHPWETVGLSAEQVDPGDYLLDWRASGFGLRYVHQFTPEELAALAADAGFSILETFASDGEGGRLSLYQIWQAA